MTLDAPKTQFMTGAEPLWPGFSQRTFAVSDPLGRDADVGDDPALPAASPGQTEFAALLSVSAAVTGSEDPRKAVRAALRAAVAATGASAAALWLFQSDGTLMRAAHHGLTHGYLEEFSSRPDWVLVQQEILHESHVLVQAVGVEPDPRSVRLEMPPGVHSAVKIPLRTRGLLVGGLIMGHESAPWAGGHSPEFLRALGETLASALDNSRILADLRASKELHEGLLSAADDGIVMVDPDGLITEVNPAIERLLGYPRSALLGRALVDFVQQRDRQSVQTRLAGLIAGGEPIRGEAPTLVQRDGCEVPVVVNATRFTDTAGQVRGAVSVIRDLREQLAAERLVREAHDQLTHLLRHLDVGVALLRRADSVVLEHNPALARMLGVPELGQRRFSKLLPEREWSEVSALLERALAAGGPRTLDDLLVRLPGRSPMSWSVTLAPLPALTGEDATHFVLTVADITARRDLEERYRHAQKMEAVGTLAGGIAHEFNNLLTAILGNVTLSLLDLPADHPLASGLRDCESAAQRAAELTSQLLGFSRRAPMRARPTDLREVIAESLPLAGRVLDPRILIERDDASDLWIVYADPGHVGQAFMNLCVNAREAMPEGGRLRVKTRNVGHGEVPEREGEYVLLEVSDTGAGIAPDVLERIFDPFFTTGGPNRGPGLGLSVVYGIAEQHGGWIDCQSVPGEGTSFRLYLPRFSAKVVEAPHLTVQGEVVLVVDDEESVRTLTRSVLERLGYGVREAADGIEALEFVREHPGDVHIVVLDQTMPRMSGGVALRELRRLAPAVPVILTSGYEPGGGPQGSDGGEADGFLPKPYSPDSLSRLVRRLLDSRRRAADDRAIGGPSEGPLA